MTHEIMKGIVRIVISVAVAVTTALIMRAIGAGEFTQVLFAGIFATIVNQYSKVK